jgi:EAL domain-containing protein (putative c-di-GMP-specific phosphodiesterase class I)
VGRQEIDEAEDLGLEPPTVSLRDMKLPEQFVEGVRQLPELLESRQVTTLFQPIVTLPSGEVAGYEALGRGCHARLPESPLDLFRVAAAVGAEAELSRLFRENAVELVRQRVRFPTLFVNVHPKELATPTLIPDVVVLRERWPQLRLTLDVHEGMLADIEIGRLRTELKRAGIGIAYDDFGAGQARLLELAEYPPDFLKFDMSFVRGIDVAPESRQRLLRSLVSVARDIQVYTVAEGVETAEEADVCMRIGFTHAQGYFFGRPRPLAEI